MAIPEIVRRHAERRLTAYCEARVPKAVRHQVRLSANFRGNTATIYEERPPFSSSPGAPWVHITVAQFRYDPAAALWTLYWADRNSRWHVYHDIEPSTDIQALLDEVEADPTGIFWG